MNTHFSRYILEIHDVINITTYKRSSADTHSSARGYGYFSLFDLEGLVSVSVDITGGTIPTVKQEVRRNSQWLKAICYFGLIISEQDPKLKGP